MGWSDGDTAPRKGDALAVMGISCCWEEVTLSQIYLLINKIQAILIVTVVRGWGGIHLSINRIQAILIVTVVRGWGGFIVRYPG